VPELSLREGSLEQNESSFVFFIYVMPASSHYFGFVHKNEKQRQRKSIIINLKSIRFLCFQFFLKTKTNLKYKSGFFPNP